MTAVFETMRVKDGAVPLLRQHLRRFEHNRGRAGLAPLPDDTATRLVEISRQRSDDHVVRVEWDGSSLAITTRDLPPVGRLDLIVSSVVHPGYAVKTTGREAFDRARAEARDRGADEALLLTAAGYVAEGTICAVGWLERDVLRLPDLDLEILPSIGRERVLEAAARAGLAVEEGHYTPADLAARPLFVTTSVRGVVGVRSLDGIPVPDHPAVALLAAGFWPFA